MSSATVEMSDSGLLGQDRKAMELFELAMEKELHGLMSDAVRYYREAFKINQSIDRLYRQQHVKEELKKKPVRKIDEEKMKKIRVDELLESFADVEATAPDPNNPEHYDEAHMAIKFAGMGLDGEDVIADVKPVLPLMLLPNEVWTHILDIVLTTEPQLWFRFGMTCKRNAYLAFASSILWRRLCYLVYPNQNYEENVGVTTDELPVPKDPLKVLPHYGNSWKRMVCERPFIKFLGCYISVVNYYSEGARPEFSLSWTNPVKTNTYYRYIRFYPNGKCVMALTTLEPTQVISQLLKENTFKCILSQADLRDPSHIVPAKELHKIYHGTWTISIDSMVSIRVDQGSVPYYTFHYFFKVLLMGIGKHAKLKWDRYYALRKRMTEDDEREGEQVDFSLKNEKPFKFLRVRSYELDN
ncbi:CIC11C00000004628 [Sungouiella intermedia]|uniref:CIC11C00000004628 n=1 Tax=Sungouiella intermedia TaxID=45354 RepID=A0A1L0DB06_9ASCO|nr:CIC11C00000004628 [[Candida] intermedia]